MADQYTMVTRLLGVMGLAHKWHVVEPVQGETRDQVWIQNPDENLDGYVRLSPVKSETLSDDEVIALIRLAIAKAADSRQRRS